MLTHNRPSIAKSASAAEKPPEEIKLTPTQDLIIGELGARRRTGEPFWPVDRRHTNALRGLQEAGLIDWWDGDYGNHSVRLTAAGEQIAFPSATYTSPLEKELTKVKTQLEILTDPSEYRPFVHPESAAAQRALAVARKALNDAADAIQELHPGEKKASVTFLRSRAANLTQRDVA